MANELSWKISAEEKRARIQKLIFRIWLPFVILGIVAATIGYSALFTYNFFAKGWLYILRQVAYMVGSIGVSLLVLLVVSKFFPYAERTYLLDESGFTISKERKKKRYAWSDFECFYNYSKRYNLNSSRRLHPQYSVAEPRRQELFGAESEIVGEIFYLRKKQKNILQKFYKSFIVMYSEPDNTNVVAKFLQGHLAVRQMKETSDLGLVFCEFK